MKNLLDKDIDNSCSTYTTKQRCNEVAKMLFEHNEDVIVTNEEDEKYKKEFFCMSEEAVIKLISAILEKTYHEKFNEKQKP